MSKELDFLSKEAARCLVSRRDFLGRAAALGITAPVAANLLTGAARAAGPNKGGTLTMGLVGGSTTDSLDPALFAADMAAQFGKAWGETLVNVMPDGRLKGVLAESWEGLDGGRKWVFELRKGVEFHNGKTLTADDVVNTLQRHAGEATKSGALGIMRGIEAIEADGKNTVVVTMKQPNADTPFLMDDYHLIIQPGGGIDDPAAGIGTGAYKVEDADHGVRYLAVKNPNHWDPEVGHVDSLEILHIGDTTARMSALQSGRIHIMNRADPKTVDLLKRVPGISVKNVSGRGHYVFVMHCDTAPFDNADLRLALKYAIDREEMVERILKGYGSTGNDFPINAAYSLFADDIEQRAYDPEKAAHHYKKSGHSGKVVLRSSDAAFPGATDAAILFQAQAKRCGIDLEIKREPADGYWSNVWNNKPFCASYWGGRPTQDLMYATGYKSDADWNDTRFFDEAFDKTLLAARAELDEVKRKDMYREMSLKVRDEGGAIIPMFNDYIDAISDRVGGYINDPQGQTTNGFAAIRCWLA